ncbi:hypothetical protein ACFL2G_03825 [Candidatus Omnitrophota bacterium]
MIDTVDIVYSALGNFSDSVTVANDIQTHESCATITVPTALSYQAAKIRVQDNDTGFDTKVYGDSTETFSVLGRIVVDNDNPGSGDNWYIGDTDKEVRWTAYGDEMTSVKIYIDYGSSYIWQKTEDTVPGSPDSWVFDDISEVGVGDYITESATIRIDDADAQRGAYTQYTSNTFKVSGKFESIQVTADDLEDTVVVAGRDTHITSTKTGALITDVVMEYTSDGSTWYNMSNDVQGDTTTTVTYSANYGWTPPITAMGDNVCQVKITDPDNSAATGITSTFTIAPKTKVVRPNSSDSWDANSTESITWQKWGDFPTVNIYYRPDDQTAWLKLNESGAVPSCQDEIDSLGDTLNGSWSWADISASPQITLSPTAEIRILDASRETYTHAILSNQFTTKGSLEAIWPNGTDYNIYECGIERDIQWKRYGNIAGVKVYYNKGEGDVLITALGVGGTVDFEGAEEYHTEAWTPPELVGKAYKIKVEDKNNPSIIAESLPFQVRGQLAITMPDAQQPEWSITESKAITWNLLHGDIANVRIILDRDGDFVTTTGDQYTIVNQTPAADETYTWNIAEQATSIIGDAGKIRVRDADTDYDVKSDSSASFTIKGKITSVSSPASGATWNVADGGPDGADGPSRTVAWNCAGDVTSVNILFAEDGVNFNDTIASGVASAAGPNTWTTDNWAGANGVQDAKADTCVIKVVDVAFGNEEVSGAFKVYPIINVTAPAQGALLRAESTGNTVSWDDHDSSRVSTVDIYLDFNAGGGEYPSNPISNWTTVGSCNQVVLPANLSEVAVFKVVDDANSEVYGESGTFKIHGSLDPADGTGAGGVTTPLSDWVIGNPATISWDYTGAISQVDIYVDYQDGNGWTQEADNITASDLSWVLNPVPDKSTDAAVIKIEDADTIRKADTLHTSSAFSVVGTFTILTPATGNVVTYNEGFTITWTPSGSTVTDVDIHYDVDGDLNWREITTDKANTGSPASFEWTCTDLIATSNARIRIKSSDPTKPAKEAISGGVGQQGLFAIHGDITYGNSPTDAEVWTVGTANNDIEWTATGKVDSVDITYSKDDGVDGFAYPITTDLDSTTNPSPYSWTIPTDEDILSNGEGLIRVKDSNYSTVYDDSPNFSVQGVLSGFNITFPADSATFPNVLRVDEGAAITWSRTGSTMGNVNIRYSTDRGVTWSSGNVLHTMTSANGGTGWAWSVDDNIVRDNLGQGKGVIVRVESVDDPRVYTQSGILSIMGRIQIDEPYQQEHNYVVNSTSEQIKWTPQGTFSTVEIDYNTSYDFTGEGDTITSSATNEADGVPTTFNWPQVPDFIRSTLFIRVADAANPDLVYSITDPAKPCKIRGSITSVSKPILDEVWNVGDLGKLVQWTANGDIASVDIDFAYDAADPATASYTTIATSVLGDGTHTWSTDNWGAGAYNGGVTDVKSDKCYIRIKDTSDSTVPPVYSAKFAVKPVITVNPIPTWVAGTGSGTLTFNGTLEEHKVTWAITGAQVSTVRLDLSYDGGGTWPFELKASVPANETMPYEITGVTLPVTLCQGNAVVRVSDADFYATDADFIAGESASFDIIGGLILSQPATGVDWKAGETKQIQWAPYGNMTGNVYVYYKYDGGAYPGTEDDSALASSGACDWTVPDHVSENVQVKIVDSQNTSTWAESGIFNIMGRFSDLQPDDDNTTIHDGDIIYAEEQTNVSWDDHNITSLLKVKLEYYTPENGDWELILDDDDPGTAGLQDLDGLVANTGSCPWTPLDSDVTDGGILRITDPDNANSEVQGTGTFYIRPKITVTGPVDPGTGILVGSTQTISWTYKGNFTGVGLYYSSTGPSGSWTLIDEGTTIYPYGPSDDEAAPVDAGDKIGSYNWTIPTSGIPLSADFYIKVAKSDEPTVVYGLSDQILMKGELEILRPKPSQVPTDALKRVYGGDVPEYCFIDWAVTGDITTVAIEYTLDDVVWTPIDTVNTATATQYNWAIPGDAVGIIGTGRNIKVYDNLAGMEDYTTVISENFEIKGEITLDYPSSTGGETFIVGIDENIQWTPYGNFPDNQVAIIGSIDNFGTYFTIKIAGAGTHGTPQTYNWDVSSVEAGSDPVPISTNVKIRVVQYNSGTTLDTDVLDTSGTMTVKGALTVDTPSQVWYVNDTNRTITWSYDGPISLVDIYIRNKADNDWVVLTDAAGYDCSQQSFSGFTVPDEISGTSKLRIKDHDDPTGTVEDISGTFVVRGRITFQTDKPSLNQMFIVGAEQQGETNDLFWDMDGTISTVEIRYDVSADPQFTPSFPIEKQVITGHTATQVYTWATVPDDMGWIYFKVMDESNPDNVFSQSNRAQIGGSITITDLTDYNTPVKVGDNFAINWTKTGAVLQDVDILYSVDGGTLFPYTIAEDRTAVDSPFPWTPQATNVLSPTTVIKIVDSDNPLVFDLSPEFIFKANWQWDSSGGFGNPGGKVWVVGEDETFEWNTNGVVPTIRIDYDVHGDDSWEATPIETSVSNIGTYTWEVPDQAGILSETVKIKISDTRDGTSILESGLFKIRGYIEVTSPDEDSEWDVNSPKTVTWIKRGPVSNVDIYYKYDGGDYTGNDIATDIPAANGTTGESWSIPNHISNNVQVKVVTTDPTEYDESDVFSIRGVISIDEHPVSTDEWVPGDDEFISWTTDGTISSVRIWHSITGLEQDYTAIALAETGLNYEWEVPDDIGSTHRIKITSNDDSETKPCVDAISDPFRIKGRLAITAPGLDDVAPVNLVTDGAGLQYPIQWTVDGTISKVELQYSYGGGGFTALPDTAATDTPPYWDAETTPGSGIGQYLWIVPNTINDTVVLRIINRDAGESDVTDDSENFIIAGRLDLTAPDGGAIYEVDQVVPITWTTRGSLGDVKLQYSINSGQSYDEDITTTGGVPAGDQSFAWTIPDAMHSSVRVKILDEDPAEYTVGDESLADFEIRGKIDILSPVTNDVWIIGTENAIQWELHGSIATVKIEFSVDGVLDPDEITTGVTADTVGYEVGDTTGEDGFGEFPWTLPNDAIGKNNVRVKITSVGDENVTVESGLFTARGGFSFVDRSGVSDDSPLAGVRWPVNSSKTIKWTTLGDITTVHVFYTLDGTDEENATWAELTNPGTGIANSGQYPWASVTNVISGTDDSLVKIKISDFNDPDAVGYSEFFTIHDIITLDRPNGTDDVDDIKTLLVNDLENIEWHSEASDTGGSGTQFVKLEYSIDGGSTWETPAIVNSTDNDGLYSWQVANAIDDEVKIRVSDINDQLVEDVSLNNCAIKPRILFSAPTGSTTWYSQDEVDIEWTSDGTLPNVEIYYSINDGDDWYQVLDEVDPIETWPYVNDGTFEWKIPDLARTDEALIKIVSSTDPNALKESAQFDIKGRLTVDFPTTSSEDTFRCGTTETLLWSTKGIISTVGLQYWYSGAFHDILNPQSGTDHVNDGAFGWVVPDIKSSDALIRVYDVDDGTVEGISLNTFDIKPRIVFEAGDEPSGGEAYAYGTPQTISWTTYGPIDDVDIEYSKDGTSTWETPKLATSTTNNDTFGWTIPDAVSDDCYIRVSDSTDLSGTNAISGKFRIRSIINLLSPNGGVQIKVGDTVNITWTQDGDTDDIYLYYFDNLVGLKRGIDEGTGIVSNPEPVGGIHTYAWTVPDFINDNVKVGVADPDDTSGAVDESTAVFPVVASFTIINPYRVDASDYSKWDIGQSYDIEWSWTGTVDSMNLYFSLDGVNYDPIQLVTGYATDPDKTATFNWFLDPDHAQYPVTPSPNFYIKVADALDPDNAYGISGQAKARADFSIDEAPQNEYVVGDTYSISWDCVGAVTNVSLHYSTDNGVTFPGSKEIEASTPNDGEYDWQIPDDISHDVRVRVKSSIDDDAYAITQTDLRIKGDLWVDSPVLDDSWDIGQPYDVLWGWKGTMPEVKITYSTNGVAGPFGPVIESYGTANDGIVANGAGAGGAASQHSFEWTIPDEAAGDAIVRVQDARGTESDILAESESFHIVGYVTVKTPISTDRLDVESPFDITWEWGGTMPEVKITYSINGLTGPFNPIKETYGTPDDGIVANGAGGGGAGSEHLFTWTVPDSISTNCMVRVADERDETVKDESESFKIQGAFTLISPAVELNDNDTPEDSGDDFYECRWVTNEIREVSWTSFGTMPKVDLVYTKDDFVTEIPLADASAVEATDIDNTGTFDWKIPDDRDETVKIRIYDHNDHEVYVEGPVAAGGVDTMKIDYYVITWDIRDLVTNQPIEGLAVSETTGWESAGLASPLTHEVPAGFWETTWSHQDFGTIVEVYLTGWDEDAQEWRGDRTIYRTMETLVVHIWRAYSEFAYDVDNDILSATSWLERDGALVSGGIIVDITIYDGLDRVKRKTVLVDETNNKFLYHDDVPKDTKLWIGDRVGEVRTMDDVISDCASYKTSEIDRPSDFGGFFEQVWSPTSYTIDTTTYDTLQAGNVYVVATYLGLTTGATFTTPVSFTIDIPQKMKDVEDAVDEMVSQVGSVLDKPISEVNTELQATLDVQTGVIDTKMQEQTVIINTKTDAMIEIAEEQKALIEDKMVEQIKVIEQKTAEMTDLVSDTMTSFETRTEGAIKDLEAGAEQAVDAGATLEETALKYSWSATLSPNPALTNDPVTLSCQGQPNLAPYLEIFNASGDLIAGTALSDGGTGVYLYQFIADDNFEAGRAYSYVIVESTTGGLVTGSGLVSKYQWDSSAFPDPALTGDTITIQCIGLSGLLPVVSVFDPDGESIESGMVMAEVGSGLYQYKIDADSSFPVGKAYTYIISEQETSTLLAGSGMVESMSMTTVAGLAAAAPEAERAAKKALDAIKAVEAVLISGESINIALTLKNLKDSVDAIPELMQKEGPSSQMTRAINEVSDRLLTLAGDEGYDMGTILKTALDESPTMKEMKNKTESIDTAVEVLTGAFESKMGGVDDPVVMTDLQSGSVVFRVVTMNPSKTKSQKVSIKKNLPVEVRPEDIMDTGGLEIEYDSANAIYYVYKLDVELLPSEIKTFEVEIEDIWVIPDEDISDIKSRVESILSKLEDTEYYFKAEEIADTVYSRLEYISTSQADESISRQRHIGTYRQNLMVVEDINKDVARMEKIFVKAGGPMAPDMLVDTSVTSDSPSKAMTWIIIFIIIIFLGLLTGVLFFTWQHQARMGKEMFSEAKKASFPEGSKDKEAES